MRLRWSPAATDSRYKGFTLPKYLGKPEVNVLLPAAPNPWGRLLIRDVKGGEKMYRADLRISEALAVPFKPNDRLISSMLYLRVHTGELTSPIRSLEDYFRKGGVSIIQAAFAHSFFVAPDEVRAKPAWYPERARYSRKHYPKLVKGDRARWSGDGREVRLDDNQYAQLAWQQYTGRGIVRGSGYGLRHIWGHPWDPDLFTAGWNFCYMPFWAGMLTERQHRHEELERAVRQASWDLYFRRNPVCAPPDFVEDPGMDLATLLDGQPLLILTRDTPLSQARVTREAPSLSDHGDGVLERVRTIRSQSHQSWSNIRKAARALQGRDHEPFGTTNVENSAKSCVRKIQREVGLSPEQIETLLDRNGV